MGLSGIVYGVFIGICLLWLWYLVFPDKQTPPRFYTSGNMVTLDLDSVELVGEVLDGNYSVLLSSGHRITITENEPGGRGVFVKAWMDWVNR